MFRYSDPNLPNSATEVACLANRSDPIQDISHSLSASNKISEKQIEILKKQIETLNDIAVSAQKQADVAEKQAVSAQKQADVAEKQAVSAKKDARFSKIVSVVAILVSIATVVVPLLL